MKTIGIRRAISRAVMATCTAAWPQTTPGGDLTQPKVFAADQAPVRQSTNGTKSRNILRGTLSTGEAVAAHESTQPVGAAPVELHPINHSELILVREGNVIFDHNGTSEKAGPGDIIFVPFGTVHRVRNVGTVPAKYVVIAIGGDVKR